MMFGMKYPKSYYDVRCRNSFSVRPWRVRPTVAPWIPKPWTDGQSLLLPEKRYLPSDYETSLHNARLQDGHHYSDKHHRHLSVIKDSKSADLHGAEHRGESLSPRSARETLPNSTKSHSRSLSPLTGPVCSANHIASSSAVCRSEGDGARLGRRMNTNGIDRSAMTGSSTTTSENINWMTAQEPATPCQSEGTRPAPSAIITSHPAGGRDLQTLMHLPGTGGIHRPSLTDPSRLYPPGYPIFTTTGSALPFSPTTYSPGSTGQLGHIPYYYPPFSPSAGYSLGGQLTTGAGDHYPGHAHASQMPYAQVLQSLTVNREHGPSLPHFPSTILPHQYPGTLTPTNSPGPGGPGLHVRRGPTSQNPLTPSHLGALHHPSGALEGHRKSPKLDPHKGEGPRGPGSLASPPRGGDYKSATGHSPLPHFKLHPAMKDSPSHEGKETSFKYPAVSKDSPRKPKYHVRPPETESYAGAGEKHGSGAQFKSEEPSPKRARTSEAAGYPGNPPPLHSVHASSIPHTSATSGSGGGGSLPPPPPLHPSYPSQPHYPPHFMKGSIIQLANNELKRVEDLRTEDFVNSADISADLKIDSSTVVRIEQSMERGTAILGFSVGEQRIQVTVEATLEHPFFVFGQGWSSCSPERTSQRYGLQCHKLSVGDVCISLTQKDPNSQAGATSTSPGKPSSSASSRGEGGQQAGVAATERANQISDSGTLAASAAVSSQSGNGRVVAGRGTEEGGARGLPLTPLVAGRSPSSASQTRKRRWSAPDQFSAESDPSSGPTPAPAKADENGHSKTKSDRDDNQGQAT